MMNKRHNQLLAELYILSEHLRDAKFAVERQVVICAASGVRSHEVAEVLGTGSSTLRHRRDWYSEAVFLKQPQ